jgi:hypothetical protein
MPHDLLGKLLEVGDTVTMACTVTQIYTGTDYCNVTLETVEKMFPGEHRTTITVNGKQVCRVRRGEQDK